MQGTINLNDKYSRVRPQRGLWNRLTLFFFRIDSVYIFVKMLISARKATRKERDDYEA